MVSLCDPTDLITHGRHWEYSLTPGFTKHPHMHSNWPIWSQFCFCMLTNSSSIYKLWICELTDVSTMSEHDLECDIVPCYGYSICVSLLVTLWVLHTSTTTIFKLSLIIKRFSLTVEQINLLCIWGKYVAILINIYIMYQQLKPHCMLSWTQKRYISKLFDLKVGTLDSHLVHHPPLMGYKWIKQAAFFFWFCIVLSPFQVTTGAQIKTIHCKWTASPLAPH